METYAALLNLKIVIPSSKTSYVAVDRDFWQSLFSTRISDVDVDEQWYLRRYPDVASAIRNGRLNSGHEHYVQIGYLEHRMPYSIEVDSNWYLSQYADVNEAVLNRTFASAQDHFEERGYREGRFPFPNFALRTKKVTSVE